LDVGTRQNERSQAPSITPCSAFQTDVIASFLDQHWGRRHPMDRSFGQGQAAAGFVQHIQSTHFWALSDQKVFGS
jgi:UDP-N-acetylglucosamine 2-epimerase (hydrolysing)